MFGIPEELSFAVSTIAFSIRTHLLIPHPPLSSFLSSVQHSFPSISIAFLFKFIALCASGSQVAEVAAP